MQYIDLKELEGNSTDKIIGTGKCGKERLDRIFDLNDKVIIFRV